MSQGAEQCLAKILHVGEIDQVCEDDILYIFHRISNQTDFVTANKRHLRNGSALAKYVFLLLLSVCHC